MERPPCADVPGGRPTSAHGAGPGRPAPAHRRRLFRPHRVESVLPRSVCPCRDPSVLSDLGPMPCRSSTPWTWRCSRCVRRHGSPSRPPMGCARRGRAHVPGADRLGCRPRRPQPHVQRATTAASPTLVVILDARSIVLSIRGRILIAEISTEIRSPRSPHAFQES